MKLGKLMLAGALAGSMSIGGVFAAFGGNWQSDGVGWRWQEDNGSYPANTWKWIDGNQDGVAECYYFDASGYCLMNAVTPDGNWVDGNGAWVVNGAVQAKAEAAAEIRAEVAIPEEIALDLIRFAGYVYDAAWGDAGYNSQPPSVNVYAASLTAEQKAFLLHAYQYDFHDSRVYAVGIYNEENRGSVSDMRDIMAELLGTAWDADMQAFAQHYASRQEGNYYYMWATGDFGGASPYSISSENVQASMENGRVKVSGNVVKWDSKTQKRDPVKQFQAYFLPSSGSCLGGYQFDQLIVQ